MFCADLQAREQVYKHNRELKGDDLVALEQVVSYCNQPDVQCEALILGGDQVDSPRIGDEHVIKLRQILRDCEAPVYYIDGNHERGFRRLELEGGEASVALNLECNPFRFDPVGVNLSVNGYNWRSRRAWEQLVEEGITPCDIRILHGFADQAVEKLGLSHTAVGLGDYNLDWFDGYSNLCLMGDIHQPMHFVGAKHSTDYYYSGSLWMHRSNEPVDKHFLVIDTQLKVTAVPLVSRPFFKSNVTDLTSMQALVTQVEKANKPTDPRISLPRVHVDIYAESNFEKELEKLRQISHLFVRIKPSQTVVRISGETVPTEVLDMKSAVEIVVPEDEKELKDFLTKVLTIGVDDAAEQLREQLGVT